MFACQPDDDVEKDIDDADLGMTKKVAAKQRRRLSVTPGLVGDITQSHQEQASVEHPANATLNETEGRRLSSTNLSLIHCTCSQSQR